MQTTPPPLPMGEGALIIPSPNAAGLDVPDLYTSKSPDYSGDDYAGDRVLHIRTRIFRYGINDKAQAAAVVLSMMLLVSALIIVLFGTVQSIFGHEAKSIDTVLGWIGNAFLFTAGVAVGKSIDSNSKNNKS